MPERYFNEEQEAHMRELGRIPREHRCVCGWYRLGQCPNRLCKEAYATSVIPPGVADVARAHNAQQPVRVESLSPETRAWLAENCWNCKRPLVDCGCIFP